VTYVIVILGLLYLVLADGAIDQVPDQDPEVS